MSSLAPFRYAEQKKEKEKHLEAAGIPLEKAYLIETADVSERRESKAKVKRKNKAAFGWDVFNEDTKAKGYDRRCEALTKRSAPAGGVISHMSWKTPPESGTRCSGGLSPLGAACVL